MDLICDLAEQVLEKEDKLQLEEARQRAKLQAAQSEQHARLGGWWRLWIVLTMLWAVIVFAGAALLTDPLFRSATRQERLAAAYIDAVIAAHPVPPLIVRPNQPRIGDLARSKTSGRWGRYDGVDPNGEPLWYIVSDEEALSAWQAGFRTQYKDQPPMEVTAVLPKEFPNVSFRDAHNRALNELSFERWNAARWSFGIIVGPSVVVLLLGALIGWIIRGFRQAS